MTLRIHSPHQLGRGVICPGFSKKTAELPKIHRHACGRVPAIPLVIAVSRSRSKRERSERLLVANMSFICSGLQPEGPGPDIGGKEMPLSGCLSIGSLDSPGVCAIPPSAAGSVVLSLAPSPE